MSHKTPPVFPRFPLSFFFFLRFILSPDGLLWLRLQFLPVVPSWGGTKCARTAADRPATGCRLTLSQRARKPPETQKRGAYQRTFKHTGRPRATHTQHAAAYGLTRTHSHNARTQAADTRTLAHALASTHARTHTHIAARVALNLQQDSAAAAARPTASLSWAGRTVSSANGRSERCANCITALRNRHYFSGEMGIISVDMNIIRRERMDVILQ